MLLHRLHTTCCRCNAFAIGVAAAASEAWKGSENNAEAGDSYTWGKVDFPNTHGRPVQITAGMYIHCSSLQCSACWFCFIGMFSTGN